MAIIVLVVILATLFFLAIPHLKQKTIAENEAKAQKTLKMLAEVSAAWRKRDGDRNRMQDYWTLDVAGFYYAKDKDGKEWKFIDIETAQADPSAANWANSELSKPYTPIPKNGYYFIAMEKDGYGNENNIIKTSADLDGKGYPGKKLCCNKTRYGFCAYPAEYGKTGKETFIINQSNDVYWYDKGGQPILQWPPLENPPEVFKYDGGMATD